ncbi:uncharacterized protein CBL_01467 [Carabus blaptoides fortunei]
MRIFQKLICLALICCGISAFSTNDVSSDIQNIPMQSVEGHGRSKRGIADEARLTTPQLIQYHDYPSEVYTVTTEDGYVLEMHRIPWSPESPQCRNKHKDVVFLMHDIVSSSADFIMDGPGKSLGYLLADAGYDVWLGNARGNRYSRNHKTMIPANNKFWDFSFHEIGYYDLPAMIDFVLNMTELPQLSYIGHSQGSTVQLVLCAEKPVYNQKIKTAYHLAPVAYLVHMRSPLLKFFALFTSTIGLFFDVVGIGEFLPKSDLMANFGQLVCKGMDFTQFICTSPLFILSGFNPNNLNRTMFPLYMGHSPAGSSTRQFIHYGQMCYSGVFRRFDMGVAENLITYGSLQAPSYSLAKVTVPVILIYSAADWLATKPDVQRLHRELPRSELHEVKDPYFAHVDFIIGNNKNEMVYDPLIEMMKYR